MQLCELGLYFSLDDFGTAYCSLGSLKQFPLLGEDRPFVRTRCTRRPECGCNCKAIIALACQFKLEIVAEGIEREAQRRPPGPRRMQRVPWQFPWAASSQCRFPVHVQSC